MTSILKNVCIDTLDDMVNKYNNTCHRTVKMKPVDLRSTHTLTLLKKIILDLKVMIM